MASFATVTAGRVISSKYRGITIRTLETTTAEEIVRSLTKKCAVGEIETVQPMPGKGNWVIVFSREELVNNCLMGIDIKGDFIIPRRVAKERYVYASVHFVPPDISNEEVECALEEFTDVKSIKHQYMEDYPHIMTGKRLVILKPHGSLPAYFNVGEVRVSLMFKGRVACCPYCDGTNHLGRNCPNKKAKKLCFGCNKPGHFKRDCPERDSRRQNNQTEQTEPAPEPATEPVPEPAPLTTKDTAEHEENSGDADGEMSEMESSHEDTNGESEHEAILKPPSPESTLSLPATELENTDGPFHFNASDTPVIFSPPSQEPEASPPAKSLTLTLPEAKPYFFDAPTKAKVAEGAKHKLPPVVPYRFVTHPKGKRNSNTISPRAGLGGYGKQKHKEKPPLTATRRLAMTDTERPKQANSE